MDNTITSTHSSLKLSDLCWLRIMYFYKLYVRLLFATNCIIFTHYILIYWFAWRSSMCYPLRAGKLDIKQNRTNQIRSIYFSRDHINMKYAKCSVICVPRLFHKQIININSTYSFDSIWSGRHVLKSIGEITCAWLLGS